MRAEQTPEKLIHVEIVTPVFNRRDITLQCLRSLARIDAENLRVHTIVVDDGSTDGTSDAIKREFPAVEIVTGDGNLWYAGGSNKGIERALEKQPDYVLLINNDTVFDNRFLRRLVETAEANPRSLVGGLLLLWDAPHRVFQVAPQWDTLYGGWRHLYRQTVWTMPKAAFDVDALSGNCILFPPEVFKENGLFDHERFPHYPDNEYTARVKKKGWRLLIEPGARVFNQPNDVSSLGKMNWRQKYQALWADARKAQNLRTRFLVYWSGAPTKLHAIAAWTIFVARLFGRSAGLNPTWETENWNLQEKPLAELYARRGTRAKSV